MPWTCCTSFGCRSWGENLRPCQGIRIISGFNPTNPATYLGFCTEFCGTQHAWMHFLLVAEPQEEFQKWEQAQVAPAPSRRAITHRRVLLCFEQMSCVNCHTIKGTIASATFGPDLTHFASRKQLGAGIREQHAGKFAPMAARSATGQGRGQDAQLQIYGRTSHAAR